MSEAQARPFSVEPQVMATLCTHLYQVTHITAVAEIYIEKFGFFGVINTAKIGNNAAEKKEHRKNVREINRIDWTLR
jgi:hypothetical protein